VTNPQWLIRLGIEAEKDFTRIVKYTADTFGERQAATYQTTLIDSRGCGCNGHPAFPAFFGRIGSGKTRAHRAAGVWRRILSSLRGAKRRSNPFFAPAWIASLRSQ
jgi:hypothetical protein